MMQEKAVHSPQRRRGAEKTRSLRSFLVTSPCKIESDDTPLYFLCASAPLRFKYGVPA